MCGKIIEITVFHPDTGRETEDKERHKQVRHQPKPEKRERKSKAGTKEKGPLGNPTVEDRIVQTALRMTKTEDPKACFVTFTSEQPEAASGVSPPMAGLGATARRRRRLWSAGGAALLLLLR